MAPGAAIHFERLAVRPQQVAMWGLPTRPTKETDSRARRWTGGESVELDAITAPNLRELLQDAILTHVDPRRLGVIEAAEASERELLLTWAEAIPGGAAGR
jgi:hypothetical protein